MNQLMVKENNVPSVNLGMPSTHEMDVMKTIALMAEGSSFYKKFPGGKSDVMMILLAARELGMPPMLALNGGIRLVLGNVEISARGMNALIRKYGHSIKIVELNEKKCTITAKRKDNGDTESCSFTFEEAKNAGLVKPKGAWEMYTLDMLFARAISRVARRLFPDVIGGCYVEGELMELEGKPSLSVEEVQKIEEVEKEEKKPEPIVTDEQAQEIEYMLGKCDPVYKQEVDDYLAKIGIQGYKVHSHMHKKIVQAAKSKSEEYQKSKVVEVTHE